MRYLFIAAMGLALSSCGGWSKGQENAFLDSCKKSPSFNCDCALKLVQEKYPNSSDFNEKNALSNFVSENFLKKNILR
jgi:hypothetical protein